ncbi:ribosomal-protein-alanine acetyltransferase [Xylanimonas cellulosilytica DSM 15894]|uniref:Ribosomal-protein-alanine acetyltransferase n=1 Tax=Xylanimonas cellulosilytica (strain DSM 15894 / JCM 12276 / CECT 5975 / KCTC 9989 / LMG 20990 / NBRC 107835 / XIL07) TaxID=446471 RepID=D1BWY3_XYLCX|nr:ribosomal protein S18-alanine N-acetyltransferase [Xylanimonas cellulosilytica]ACZ29715.1 ribosomal-protein-alanine acetyltransferase [Xylanimonas cellulosilytica DSM 15894]
MVDDATLTPAGPATSGAPVRLRALRRDDFDRILELERELFGLGAWTYGMLAEELAGWGRWYIVAEEVVPDVLGRAGAGRARGTTVGQVAAARVVGYAGLWFDGDVTQVMTLGVDPDWQRRGVGRTLMDALIARSRELRASAVLLEVRVDNEPALDLYADLGFERIGLRKRYYQPENMDAYTMRLDLAARTQEDAS